MSLLSLKVKAKLCHHHVLPMGSTRATAESARLYCTAGPLQYSTRALLVNEFTGPRWNRPDPNNPAMHLGQSLLNRYNFPPDYWYAFPMA